MNLNLKTACDAIKCTERQCIYIEELVRDLALFHVQKEAYTKSQKQRLQDLKHVEELIRDLNATIDDLDPRDRQAIKWEGKDAIDESEFIGESWNESLSQLLNFVSVAIPGVNRRVVDSTKSRGRVQLNDLYAISISNLAFLVPSVKPERRGKFEELCNAVFEEAKIGVTAESALKKMLETYKPSKQEDGNWELLRK